MNNSFNEKQNQKKKTSKGKKLKTKQKDIEEVACAKLSTYPNFVFRWDCFVLRISVWFVPNRCTKNPEKTPFILSTFEFDW